MPRSWILNVEEERIPKEKPPRLEPVPTETRGDLVIMRSTETRFRVFGRTYNYAPRDVSSLYRVLTRKQTVYEWSAPEEKSLDLIARDDPESVLRVWNYARHLRGRVLVLGMGFALFPRLAVRASEIIVVEPDIDLCILLRDPIDRILRDVRVLSGVSITDYLKSKRAPEFDYVVVSRLAPDVMRTSALVHLARKRLKMDGHIVMPSYGDIVKGFQERCQVLVTLANVRGGPENLLSRELTKEERMFLAWGARNKRRVFDRVDYKFINSWAEKTVLELVE